MCGIGLCCFQCGVVWILKLGLFRGDLGCVCVCMWVCDKRKLGEGYSPLLQTSIPEKMETVTSHFHYDEMKL